MTALYLSRVIFSLGNGIPRQQQIFDQDNEIFADALYYHVGRCDLGWQHVFFSEKNNKLLQICSKHCHRQLGKKLFELKREIEICHCLPCRTMHFLEKIMLGKPFLRFNWSINLFSCDASKNNHNHIMNKLFFQETWYLLCFISFTEKPILK